MGIEPGNRRDIGFDHGPDERTRMFRASFLRLQRHCFLFPFNARTGPACVALKGSCGQEVTMTLKPPTAKRFRSNGNFVLGPGCMRGSFMTSLLTRLRSAVDL